MSKSPVKSYFPAVVERGTEHVIAERIRKIDDVTEVLVIYGMWDTIACIDAEGLEKLDKIITAIRRFPEIRQTNTLVGGRE